MRLRRDKDIGPSSLEMVIKIRLLFHSKVSNRKKRNMIKWLEDNNGVQHRNIEGMKNVVVDYCSDLFASSRPEITLDQLDFIDNRI